jgi:hypothetical protein
MRRDLSCARAADVGPEQHDVGAPQHFVFVRVLRAWCVCVCREHQPHG